MTRRGSGLLDKALLGLGLIGLLRYPSVAILSPFLSSNLLSSHVDVQMVPRDGSAVTALDVSRDCHAALPTSKR